MSATASRDARVGIPGSLYRAYLAPGPGEAPAPTPAPGAAPVPPLAPRAFRFVARGPEAPDRNGLVVRLAGLDLAAYAANGPVLFAHEPLWPVGQARAYLAAGRLLADVLLAPPGASAVADSAAALVSAGVLRGLSVGVRTIRSRLSDDGRVLDVQRCELVELSLVAIPADPTALRIA